MEFHKKLIKATQPFKGNISVVWGEVNKKIHKHRKIILSWGKNKKIQGWIVTTSEAIKDPRIKQVLIIIWRNNSLKGAHPSNTSSKIPIEPASKYPKTFFMLTPKDLNKPACMMFDALDKIKRCPLFWVMEIK